MRDDIAQALQLGNGVIGRRDHPDLAQRLDRLRTKGELVAILPGLFVESGTEGRWDIRLSAALRWLGPDAVLGGYGAARMTFWTDCPRDDLSFVTPHSFRPRRGWTVTRGQVPAEMIWHRNRAPVTCVAYTAVELAAGPAGGDILDRALRSRQARLPQMWQALDAMAGRAGNRKRRWLLRDSRDEPWSELERAGHRLLRSHRLTGWKTNAWTPTANGGYLVDVLFERHRLVIEFDGYQFHSVADTFEKDRRRRNELELAGYTVLNFTWAQVINDPAWVLECICRAIRM